MSYSRINLSTGAAGQPDKLPSELIGLDDATLANLPAAIDPVPVQFAGIGYWPATIASVEFDPRAQAIASYVLAPDRATKTVLATPVLRDLTADELAALPPLPPEIISPLSDRQFFQALATAPYGIISAQESLDAVKTGEIPAVMQAVIDALPAQAQYEATMLIAGATEFKRDNPLVEVFGASQGMDASAIDTFWRFAGRL